MPSCDSIVEFLALIIPYGKSKSEQIADYVWWFYGNYVTLHPTKCHEPQETELPAAPVCQMQNVSLADYQTTIYEEVYPIHPPCRFALHRPPSPDLSASRP